MSNQAEGKVIQTAEGDTSSVALHATFEISRNYITIRYSVRSKANSSILLFDAPRRIAQDGNLKYDAHLAYVSFEPPTTLAVKRIIPSLPIRKSVEMARDPLAHQLSPGATVNGEIQISLPASEYSPYYPPDRDSSYSQESARELKLVLEYALPSPDSKAVPISGLEGLYHVEGRGAKFEVVEISIHLVEPIRVQRRRDIFEPV